MQIIFCSEPLEHQIVDADYEREYQAAQKCGFNVGLINYEELILGNTSKALKRIDAEASLKKAIYRGWMMQPEVYLQFYQGLRAKNIELINNDAEYRHCHYLPESYEIICDLTPKTVWLNNIKPGIDEIMTVLKPFGEGPIIVKDYVKSQKHCWNDACFITAANNQADVNKIVSCFLQLQGDDINEGLVFREFVLLESLKKHSKSGMPLTKEFRVFFLYGRPLIFFPYWDEGDYGLEKPELHAFLDVAKKVKSNFFTMDIAREKAGSWIIIELGDGQVAGLPDNFNENEFYSCLKKWSCNE